MTARHSLVPVLVALVAAVPSSAQLPTGTIVMGIHIKVPDSLKAVPLPLPGGSALDMHITVISDGRRVAIDLTPGDGFIASVPMLAGVRVHAMYGIGADTLHGGVVLPPALAGGAPGYRFDVPLKMLDSIRRAGSHVFDSISRKLTDSMTRMLPHPMYRSLGTPATVAGLTCEEWETVIATDTTRSCLIPTPVMMRILQDQFQKALGVKQLMDQVPGFSAAAREAFGGRDMTAIRTSNAKLGLLVELERYSPALPDAAGFDLPPGLQPFPGSPGAKPPGGGSGTDRR